MKSQPSLWQVGIILVAGVLAVSAAAVLIRLSIEAAGTRSVGFSLFVAATRLTIAALIFLPAWGGVFPPSSQQSIQPRAFVFAVGAGVALALHFATWITSLSFTTIAASTTIVTTNPVWVALLSWFWLRERPSNLTMIGIALALTGGIIIAFGDTSTTTTASNPLLGDFLALLGSWGASCYLLLGQQAQKRGLGTSSYVAIAYTTAAVVLIPLPLFFGTGYTGYPWAVYGYIGLMAVLSQVIGHTTLNWAVQWISPTLVTLAILFEPISSSILGYFIFQEVPKNSVLFGALIVLVGVAIAVREEHRKHYS